MVLCKSWFILFQFAENFILNPCLKFRHLSFLGNQITKPESVNSKNIRVAIPTMGRPTEMSNKSHRCNLNMERKNPFNLLASYFKTSPVYGFTLKIVPRRSFGEVLTRNS